MNIRTDDLRIRDIRELSTPEELMREYPLGEHASAAACMDAVAVVGRAHSTREEALVKLADLMPAGRFLGVLLVG